MKDNVYDVPGGSNKIYFDVDLNELDYFGYIFSDLTDVTDICFGENFRSTNVTDMSALFNQCSGLNTIEFGDNFDTSNVVYMNRMFSNCPNLTSIDLSGFDCSKVKEANSMFYMSAFTNLDLSMLDFSNCQNFYFMFYDSKITSLDLSNWNIKNATSIDGMFNRCYDLQSIKMGK
ncbi:MAG: DUF285 domain-containing protein [Clostridia bacterium]|nr:DUF285 domain-containing protein [Clostridia bacterium]